MIHTVLPYNQVISYMKYSNEVITIGFKKPNYERMYNANQELAYKLFYSKTAADCLKIYNEIKKLCPVINVKPL
jgi:ABC-type enterochelin transport system substrate-binding protein